MHDGVRAPFERRLLVADRLGEDHDRRTGRPRRDLGEGREAVDARHREVEDDDVGPELGRERDRLVAAARLTDDLERVGLGERRAEQRTHRRRVVDQ